MTNTFNRNSFSFPPAPALWELGQLFGKCINQLSEGTKNWVSISRTDKRESFYIWVVLMCTGEIDQRSKYFGNSIKQKDHTDNHNGGKGISNVDVLSMWQMQLGKWNSRWFISEWRGRWTQSWFRHLLSRMWWKHYFRKKKQIKKLFSSSRCASIVCQAIIVHSSHNDPDFKTT